MSEQIKYTIYQYPIHIQVAGKPQVLAQKFYNKRMPEVCKVYLF